MDLDLIRLNSNHKDGVNEPPPVSPKDSYSDGECTPVEGKKPLNSAEIDELFERALKNPGST